LRNMDKYFEYFLNELGGKPTTSTELHALLASSGVVGNVIQRTAD